MKSEKILQVLTCAVFTFTPVICFSQNAAENGDTIVNMSLRQVKEIVPYVELYWTGDKQIPDLEEKIENFAIKLLNEAEIKVGSSEPNEAAKKFFERKIQEDNLKNAKIKIRTVEMPELMIRIYVIKHQPTDSFVFNVQTSLARKVYTSQSIRSATKAEVWRIDVGPSAVDANNFELMLKGAVEGQVGKFIEEYSKANSLRPNIAENEKSEKVNQRAYVASANSPVFHKANCPSVKRISPENLVGYSTREEAIENGKRPCKMCKP